MSRITRSRSLLLACILMLAVTLITSTAYAGRDDLPGSGGKGARELACLVGRTLDYDYEGTFISEAEVQSSSGTSFNSAALETAASVRITAIEAALDTCTYEVVLDDVKVLEVVGREIVESAEGEELGSDIGVPYYFTQSRDGTIREIIIGDHEGEETVNYKRGVVNAFNVTLRDGETYDVVESDISGTYTAHYTVVDGRDGIDFARAKDHKDYLGGEGGRGATQASMPYNMSHNSSSTLDPILGVIGTVNISEVVIVDEPDGSDAPVSDTFQHDTLTVRASVAVELVSVSSVRNVRAARAGVDAPGMLRIPVAAPLAQPDSPDLDNSANIAALLEQTIDHAAGASLLNELVAAMKVDSRSSAQVDAFLGQHELSREASQLIVAALAGVGSAESQAVIVNRFLSGDVTDADRLQDALITASTIQQPTADLIRAVAALSNNAAYADADNAALVLGALVGRAAAAQPQLADAVVAQLERRLTATGDVQQQLALIKALGNAGLARSVAVVGPFLASESAIVRIETAEALGEMDSAEADALLLARLQTESHEAVIMAIALVLDARGQAGGGATIMGDPILDWAWEKIFGNNTANVTLSASALVEAEPLLVDAQASAVANLFSFSLELAKAQLLTEKTSETERRFYLGLTLVGEDVWSFDHTVTCGISGGDTIWDETINLPTISTPPIPIAGPLTLSFSLESSLEFELSYFWSMSWCDVTSADATLGLTPEARVDVDGYATLTLLVIRGGVGIDGTLIGARLPIYFTAELHYQNGVNLCFTIDFELIVLDMELYAWAQGFTFFFGWQPNPRPHWKLWSFNLSPDAYTLYQYCTDGGTPEPCMPSVVWWDGTVKDAWYDGANCFVAGGYPTSMGPFISNDAYYLTPTTSTTCPAGTSWDGTGCFILTHHPFMMPFTIGDALYIDSFFGASCPANTIPVEIGWPPEIMYCFVMNIPAGHDWFDTGVTLYLTPEQLCSEGDLDNIGCWLGDAPGNTSPFHYAPTAAFYYSE